MSKTLPIHPLAWFLIIGTGLSRMALFITLPYLSIYISNTLQVVPAVTGIVVGLAPLAGICGAFLMGYLSDRIGRVNILKGSLLGWSVAFLGLSFSNKLWQFAILNILYGICRASFESVASALLSDISPTEIRKKVFHLRYFAINVGACFGPPVGAWLITQQAQSGFWITSVAYLIYFVLLTQKLNTSSFKFTSKVDQSVTLRGVLQSLRKDSALFCFLAGNIVMLLGFAQIETNVPQYLQNLFQQQGIKFFGYLIMTNALTVVLFQYPLTQLTKRLSLVSVVCVGFLLYGIGFTSFACFETIPYAMIGSMVIFTFGEILVFSNTYVLIDQISPPNLKGSYFGIVEMAHLGLVIGPFVGGLIIQYFAGKFLFLFLGAMSLGSIFLFLRGNRILQKRLNAQ